MIRLSRAALRACLLLPLALLGCVSPGAASQPGITATVAIAPAPYQLAATAHRWVAADIFSYSATLYQLQGSEYVPVGSVADVAAAASQVTFQRLTSGRVYRVTVVAHGNIGGTAGTTVLNSLVPANASIDLTTAGNSTATVQATATVALDPVAADPSLPVTVSKPTADGVFLDPAASEVVVVRDPAATETVGVR